MTLVINIYLSTRIIIINRSLCARFKKRNHIANKEISYISRAVSFWRISCRIIIARFPLLGTVASAGRGTRGLEVRRRRIIIITVAVVSRSFSFGLADGVARRCFATVTGDGSIPDSRKSKSDVRRESSGFRI